MLSVAFKEVLEDPKANPKVSRASSYHDKVWRMDGWRPGAHSNLFLLRWDFEMSDGSHFVDTKWSDLRSTAKLFLLSLSESPVDGRGSCRSSTVSHKFTELRVFIRWIADNGLRRFADVDSDLAGQFMEYMSKRPGMGGRPLTISSLQRYANLLKSLYMQGSKIGGGLASDPFPGCTPGEAISRGKYVTTPNGRLPYTPDEIAVPIISSAIRLIGAPADDILALRDKAQGIYDSLLDSGASFDGVSGMVRRRIAGFEFSTIDGEGAPWREPFHGGTRDLAKLVQRVFDACFVVIAYLVGCRYSEIVNLKPGCVTERKSSDGADTYQFIEGTIFKTARNEEGNPHLWAAPPPAVRAIEVMERLSAPYRALSDHDVLFQSPVGSGLIGKSKKITCIDNASWGQHLRDFISFVKPPEHASEDWRISPHQARKTFARFVGKRDRTGLHALQKHFGHVSRVMTDSAYVGTDFELTELIDKETLQETRDALEELFRSDKLAGPAGRRISQNNRFRGRTTKADVNEYVDWILSETQMRLGVCDWGYCLYRRESSACQGDDNGPNETLRTESVCNGCPNFVVSTRHAPFWERRLQRNEKILERDDLDPVSRALAKTRANESRRILMELSDGK